MAKVEWAFICKYAAKDADGNICIMGMFDAIRAKEVPIIPPRGDVVFRVSADPGSLIETEIKIRRSDGTRVFKTHRVSYPGSRLAEDIIAPNFLRRKFPRFGDYVIGIFLNGDYIRKCRNLSINAGSVAGLSI